MNALLKRADLPAREVEDVLYAHPRVKEAAVIGVPNAYRGETVKAVIVPSYASEFSALAIATSEMLVVNKVSSPMVGPFKAEAVSEVPVVEPR